jgi:hypothetical protein
MEGKDSGEPVATRVRSLVSHTEEGLEVGPGRVERASASKRQGERRGGSRRQRCRRSCGGVTFFEGCMHIGERGCSARNPMRSGFHYGGVSRGAASIGPGGPGSFGSQVGLDIVDTGPIARWVSSRGLGSAWSRGVLGDGCSGGRSRVRGSRGRWTSSKRCESCPAGVQQSPSGDGTRTVEVVRNHEGGSRSAARGGGRSEVGVAEAVPTAGPSAGVRKQGANSRANLQERRFRPRTARPYPRGREERSSAA